MSKKVTRLDSVDQNSSLVARGVSDYEEKVFQVWIPGSRDSGPALTSTLAAGETWVPGKMFRLRFHIRYPRNLKKHANNYCEPWNL